MQHSVGANSWWQNVARRPILASAVLLVVYGCLSLLMDPHGYLGTDTGSKVATLEVMDRAGSFDLDVGYWAEELDPDGALHPFYQSSHKDDGSWVAVTTLPLLSVARPLYALGGYRLTLVLPMLGSVAVALAAAALARRLGDRDGAGAFWLVGLASPMVIYALDLWEHSIGVALVLWAVVLLLDIAEGASTWRALAAGAMLGVAASLRTESIVYALVAVGVACVVQLQQRRSLGRPVVTGVLAVAGFGVTWGLNVALERSTGGISRSSRATGVAGSGGSKLDDRIQESLQTLVGQNASGYAVSVFIGLALVLVIVLALRAESRGDLTFARFSLVLGGCVYVFGVLDGLGFVPGLVAAFPVALAAVLHLNRTSASRMLGAIAVCSLPMVYAFQYVGGGAPQWGGRYTLASAILLGVIGLVGLTSAYPVTGRGVVALCVLVTVLGVAWLGVRTRGVDDFFDDVEREAAPVVVARQAFLIREAGPAALGRRWFSVKDELTFTAAVDATRTLGEDRFSVLEWGDAAPPPEALPDDVREVDRQFLEFVNVPVGLVTYEFTG